MLIPLLDIAPGAVPTAADYTFALIVTLVVVIPFAAYMILTYVLHAKGLAKLAKRRGIHHPWLAWIPCGQEWLLGCLSDQYQYLAQGKVRFNRRWLLIVSVPTTLLSVAIYVCFVIVFPISLSSPDFLTALETISESDLYAMFPSALTGLLNLLSIGLVVFRSIALYHLFASSYPRYKVPLLLISIFVEHSVPFLIFAVRDHDKGMPPRRFAPPVQPET